MRALIAGPRTAVGGFQTKLAVFKPSPAAEKLFGIGIGESNAPTFASSVFPVVLLVPVLMSYVRTERRAPVSSFFRGGVVCGSREFLAVIGSDPIEVAPRVWG